MTDDVLMQAWRSAHSLAETLRKAAIARGLVVCPNCGDKHKGMCTGAAPQPPQRARREPGWGTDG